MPNDIQELLQKDIDNANELYTKIKEFSKFITKEYKVFTVEHLLKIQERLVKFEHLLKQDLKGSGNWIQDNKGITLETKSELNRIQEIIFTLIDKLRDSISEKILIFDMSIDEHDYKRGEVSKLLRESAEKDKQDLLQLQDQLNKAVLQLQLALQDKDTLEQQKKAELNRKISYFNRKIMDLELANGDVMHGLQRELDNKKRLLQATDANLATANNDKKTLQDDLDWTIKNHDDTLRLKMRALKITEGELQEEKKAFATERHELREALKRQKQALDRKTDQLEKTTSDLENARKEIEKLKNQNLELQASNVRLKETNQQLKAESEIQIQEKNQLIIREKNLTEEQILFQRKKVAWEEAYAKSARILEEKEKENNNQLQQINVSLIDLTQQLSGVNKQQQQILLDTQVLIKQQSHSEDERLALETKKQELNALAKALEAQKTQLQNDIKHLHDREQELKQRSKFLQEQLSKMIEKEGFKKYLMQIEEQELELSVLRTAKGGINANKISRLEWDQKYIIQTIQVKPDLRRSVVEHYRYQHAYLDTMLKEAGKDLKLIDNNNLKKLTDLINALDESSSELAILLNSQQPNSKLIASVISEWQKGKKLLSDNEKECRKFGDPAVLSIIIKLQQGYDMFSVPQIAPDGSYYSYDGFVFVSLGKDDLDMTETQATPPVANQLYYPHGEHPIMAQNNNNRRQEAVKEAVVTTGLNL